MTLEFFTIDILTLKQEHNSFSQKGRLTARQTLQLKVSQLPILDYFSCGPPGEGVAVSAVSHGDVVSADCHTDSIWLVVDSDGAKVGVEFGALGAD